MLAINIVSEAHGIDYRLFYSSVYPTYIHLCGVGLPRDVLYLTKAAGLICLSDLLGNSPESRTS